MNKEIAESIMTEKNNLEGLNCVDSKLFGIRKQDVVFSIMIPTYKRMELLEKCVSSVINQRGDINYEVVIVDNNDTSDDEIWNFLRKYNDCGICYYRNSHNIGMFGNWNRCISLAKGEWLLILNDDDELEPDYLEQMQSYVNDLPNCMAIGCQNYYIDDKGDVLGYGGYGNKKRNEIIRIKEKDFYFFHPINIFGCLINTAVARKIGGFDPKLFPVSDAEFLFKICQVGNLYLCSDYLFRYRWAVNESQKVSTQVDFMLFQMYKAQIINGIFHFFPSKLDYALRKQMYNFSIWQLETKNNVSLDDLLEENGIKELKELFGKYNRRYASIYRVFLKIYRTMMWKR